MVSRPRDSLSIPPPVARNNGRFSGRPDFVANKQDRPAFAKLRRGRHPRSNLGTGAFRAQPGVVDGVGISREQRPRDVVPLGLRGLDVSPESTGARRIIFCPRLSDQDCAAPLSPGVFFLLAVAKKQRPIFDHRSSHHLGFVDRALAEFSNAVCQKCPRLRKLLGTLGNYLFGSIDRVQSI